MKKALVVFLALAMVAGVFADEPVAGVAINTFTGSEKVEWGVDLDTGRTGFKNTADVTFKIDLVAGGTKETTGEGVWGDIQIKTDGDSFFVMKSSADGESDTAALPAVAIKIDHAKLHIGPAYIGITSGNTTVGEYNFTTGLRSSNDDIANIGPDGYKYGITAGYSNDMFGVDLDIRSKPAFTNEVKAVAAVPAVAADPAVNVTITYITKAVNDSNIKYTEKGDQVVLSDGTTEVVDKKTGLCVGDVYYAIGEKTAAVPAVPAVAAVASVEDAYYSNTYAFALDASLKMVANATIKFGGALNMTGGSFFNNAIIAKNNVSDTYATSSDIAAYVQGDYKLAIGDKYFVKPQVAFTYDMGKTIAIKDKNGVKEAGDETSESQKANVAAAVFFGWGKENTDSNAGVPFFDGDSAKKRSDGVSVKFAMPVINKVTTKGTKDIVTETKEKMNLTVSAFSGSIVPNLTAALWFDMDLGSSETTSDDKSKVVEANSDMGMEFGLGASYALTVGAGTITPNFGIVYANKFAATTFASDTSYASGTYKTFKSERSSDGKTEEVLDKDQDAVGALNLKVGASASGFVANTTFGVDYASGNLSANGIKVANTATGKNQTVCEAGTVTVWCKISL